MQIQNEMHDNIISQLTEINNSQEITITYLMELIKSLDDGDYDTSLEALMCKDLIIVHLLDFIGKYLPFTKKPIVDEPISLEYRKLLIDGPPIFEHVEKIDHRVLLCKYFHENGKHMKPIKRHIGSTPIPKKLCCPHCDAPSDYIYANNGLGGQFSCKICECRFSEKNRFSKQVILKCPHCRCQLEHIKIRDDFDIHKCKNDDCKFYQKNLSNMTKQEKKLFKRKPYEFKVRYIYRSFKIDFVPLSTRMPDKPNTDLSKITASPEVLGLILTYNINYGLSARSTSAIMWDVHNVKVSKQTVLNYVNALRPLMEYFNHNFQYKLSGQYCGDETYIRIRGKWHYLCFFFDAVHKIILSYPISAKRDTNLAVQAIDELLVKLPEKEIPDKPEHSHKLKLIVDGNPIYPLAQMFFAENQINFDIKQVIGLTNKDAVSKEYRPLKNIIERLNRTYKTGIQNFYGFGTLQGAENFTTLFVSFFNFLRPHSAFDDNVPPVVLDELLEPTSMAGKWVKLISMAQEFALGKQQPVQQPVEQLALF